MTEIKVVIDGHSFEWDVDNKGDIHISFNNRPVGGDTKVTLVLDKDQLFEYREDIDNVLKTISCLRVRKEPRPHHEQARIPQRARRG